MTDQERYEKYIKEPFLAEEVNSFKYSCYKMIRCLFTLINKVNKISIELGFDNKKLVLIVMGSLGSYTINNV